MVNKLFAGGIIFLVIVMNNAVSSGPIVGPTPTVTPTPSSTPAGSPLVVFAVGDIAECNGHPPAPTNGAFITANMLLQTRGPIFTLGDNSNDNGTTADYANCFSPTWGSLYSRLYPSMGNHDMNYPTNDGLPYYAYFSGKTGTNGRYSLNLGSWHIIVLNAQCNLGVGCGPNTTQEKWLRADLAANTKPCILAIWHQPLFTSGHEIPYTASQTFWQDLYAAHADLILNGHNHIYERFAPQDPYGNADPTGIREVVVGTGGAHHQNLTTIPMAANEEVRNEDTYGYLQLSLYSNGYAWQFFPQPGMTFTDQGFQGCH